MNEESTFEGLVAWDYVVIVLYFGFVLFVGLWVKKEFNPKNDIFRPYVFVQTYYLWLKAQVYKGFYFTGGYNSTSMQILARGLCFC